jgi:hypothetical protein
MFIKNENMANVELRLPNGKAPKGDPEGIFEVPDDIGKALCDTPGWAETDQAPQKVEEIDPVAALKELRRLQAAQAGQGAPVPPAPITAVPSAPKPPVPPAPAPAPAPEPEPPATDTAETVGPPPDDQNDSGESDPEEGPDLTSMTKNELLATAVEYGIELSAEQKKGKVGDLRKYIDKKLYGE